MTVLKRYELARVYTSSIGTGSPLSLGAAVPGYLTFAQAGAQNDDLVPYSIRDGVDSEVGIGVYNSTGPMLTRNVSKSTNADAPINLSGSAEIFSGPRAADFGVGPNQALTLDDNGRIPSIVRPVRGVTGAGNITLADNGCVISCSGTPPYTLTHAMTAAQAGNGFRYTIRNTTAGTITIDPAGSEQIAMIDGVSIALTLSVFSREKFDVVCDGSNWIVVGRWPVVLLHNYSIANVSAIDLSLPPGYYLFEIKGDLILSASTYTWAHYWSGATPIYQHYTIYHDALGSGASIAGEVNASQFMVTQGSNANTPDGSFEMTLWPEQIISGRGPRHHIYSRNIIDNAAAQILHHGVGMTNYGVPRIDKIRFFCSSGLLTSGRIACWGRII
jgi:hypothetical protein